MVTRLTRMVEARDWCLSATLGTRKERLLDVPQPKDLLDQVNVQIGKASRNGSILLTWQESTESPGYFRLVAQVPLSEITFDQVFNGRSGYRAQYYLSPEEGILYNRDILECLIPSFKVVCQERPLNIGFELIEKSLQSPHSKIWIFEEKLAFDEAEKDTLNPARWVANGATRGRKVPLPSHRKIEVKGAFINPGTSDLFVDELKLDRAWDLFRQGYT